MTVPSSRSVPGAGNPDRPRDAGELDPVALTRGGPRSRRQALIGVEQLVLDDRRLSPRPQRQVLAQPAAAIAPAERQLEPVAERAQLTDRELGVADLGVALHHIARPVGGEELVDAAARRPGPGVAAFDRALDVGRLRRGRRRSQIGIVATRRSRSPAKERTSPGPAARLVHEEVARAVQHDPARRRARRPASPRRSRPTSPLGALVEADRVPDRHPSRPGLAPSSTRISQ